MKKTDVFRAWNRILTGSYPMLSIEITRECPLRCPGCYAYELDHLGPVGPLRTVADFAGQELIDRVLEIARHYRPVHISIVGGEPLVRFRELDVLLPQLCELGIEIQLVTSAVRPIPQGWAKLDGLHLAVSVDGLQPDHDRRRAPATYDRILKNIVGHSLIVHCTVTRQMALCPGYFEEFLTIWSAVPEVRKIWFSLFTPQVGAQDQEVLPAEIRARVIDELAALRPSFPKMNLPNSVVRGYRQPPQSPSDCIFSRTTLCITADLKSRITPCQFGGNPDCSQCGCMASAGMKAVGDHRFLGILPLNYIYRASDQFGKLAARVRRESHPSNGGRRNGNAD